MAGNKYIANSAGALIEVAAIQSTAGAGDAGKIPALDSAGLIAANMMPVGIGADIKSVVSSENLAASDLVNVYDNGGTLNVRKADASNGRTADGFVLAAVTSPAACDVYKSGSITGLTGKTPGAAQFLSATAGLMTETAPSTPGQIVQRIGKAFGATEVDFEPSDAITLA